MRILVIKAPFDLFQGDRLLYSETLTGEDPREALAALAEAQWKSIYKT